MERKLFTALQGEHSEKLNDSLSKQGFRRSQNVLYRPSCADCSACFSARIRVADFKPSKSQRRAAKKNADLQRKATSPWASDEQYDLFRRYLNDRHSDGGMADMDDFEFAAMIEETPIRSRVIEYSSDGSGGHPRGQLSACCLTDVLDDGLSMVYSFYEPERVKNSVGTYVILDHIEIARDAGLPYVYLGYWVPGSPKMSYKARFSGLEIYYHGSWRDIGNVDDYSPDDCAPQNDPISDQVARIDLPDTMVPSRPVISEI